MRWLYLNYAIGAEFFSVPTVKYNPSIRYHVLEIFIEIDTEMRDKWNEGFNPSRRDSND